MTRATPTPVRRAHVTIVRRTLVDEMILETTVSETIDDTEQAREELERIADDAHQAEVALCLCEEDHRYRAKVWMQMNAPNATAAQLPVMIERAIEETREWDQGI